MPDAFKYECYFFHEFSIGSSPYYCSVFFFKICFAGFQVCWRFLILFFGGFLVCQEPQEVPALPRILGSGHMQRKAGGGLATSWNHILDVFCSFHFLKIVFFFFFFFSMFDALGLVLKGQSNVFLLVLVAANPRDNMGVFPLKREADRAVENQMLGSRKR